VKQAVEYKLPSTPASSRSKKGTGEGIGGRRKAPDPRKSKESLFSTKKRGKGGGVGVIRRGRFPEKRRESPGLGMDLRGAVSAPLGCGSFT